LLSLFTSGGVDRVDEPIDTPGLRDDGLEVAQLTRRRRSDRASIDSITTLTGDADDPQPFRLPPPLDFDNVANFRAYRPEQVAADIELLGGRGRQCIFASSAAVDQNHAASLPTIESTPLRSPGWRYPRDKIA